MRLAITTFATLCSLTGCLVHGSQDDSTGTGGGGDYQVTSQIDITIETLLPQPVEDIVSSAREFSVNPAHTLITLADSAGVPAVGTLRDYLPDYVEGKLEGWINDEIAKLTIAGIPVTQVAGTFAALAETTLTQVSLESELT